MNDEQVNVVVYNGSDVIVGGTDGGRRILGDLRVQQQLLHNNETPLFLQRMELNNIRQHY